MINRETMKTLKRIGLFILLKILEISALLAYIYVLVFHTKWIFISIIIGVLCFGLYHLCRANWRYAKNKIK